MAGKSGTRIVWNEEDAVLMLPTLLSSMEEGCSLLQATRIAQKLLPKERQREFLVSEQNVPDVVRVAIRVAKLKELKVEKVAVPGEVPPPPPFKCKRSGTEDCPVEKVLKPEVVAEDWIRKVLAGAFTYALGTLNLKEALADAVADGLSKHYVPKDPMMQAAAAVKGPPQGAVQLKNPADVKPATPVRLILVLGLANAYRDRLLSTFAGRLNFKFWNPDAPTQDLLDKAKQCEVAVADMATISAGNVRVARAAGYTVDEVKDGKSAEAFVQWCDRYLARIERAAKAA